MPDRFSGCSSPSATSSLIALVRRFDVLSITHRTGVGKSLHPKPGERERLQNEPPSQDDLIIYARQVVVTGVIEKSSTDGAGGMGVENRMACQSAGRLPRSDRLTARLLTEIKARPVYPARCRRSGCCCYACGQSGETPSLARVRGIPVVRTKASFNDDLSIPSFSMLAPGKPALLLTVERGAG
jgi:hypothetical protein